MMSDNYGKRPKDGMGKIGPPERTYPEFKPPEGAELEGPKGTASVQWRRKPNGSVCITAINGVSLGGAPEPDEGEDDMMEDETA